MVEQLWLDNHSKRRKTLDFNSVKLHIKIDLVAFFSFERVG